jgi:hypothetical protein
MEKNRSEIEGALYYVHSVHMYCKNKIFNPVSNRWLRETLCTCDGSFAMQRFPLFVKTGNDSVTLQVQILPRG